MADCNNVTDSYFVVKGTVRTLVDYEDRMHQEYEYVVFDGVLRENATEIVFCRDCKHRYGTRFPSCCDSGPWGSDTNGFCSWGEKAGDFD